MCLLLRRYINCEIPHTAPHSFINRFRRLEGRSMPINKLQKRYLCVLLFVLSPTVLTFAIRNEKFTDWDGDSDLFLNSEIQKKECANMEADEKYDSSKDDDEFMTNSVVKNSEIGHLLADKFQGTKRNSARIMPIYHSGHQIHCSCGIEYRLLDLGHLYFPRFIHTGICQANGCPYKCSGKEYKVRVLRKRNVEDGLNFDRKVLPENLRANYTSETIPVTVACECVP